MSSDADAEWVDEEWPNESKDDATWLRQIAADGDFFSCGIQEEQCDRLRAIAARLASPAIPVEERLPELGEMCLAYGHIEGWRVNCWQIVFVIGTAEERKFTCVDVPDTVMRVTHWAPLPPPPTAPHTEL